MNTSPNAPSATPSQPLIPVWYKIGAVLLVVVMMVLFFTLASARMGHLWHKDIAPGTRITNDPGQVIAH